MLGAIDYACDEFAHTMLGKGPTGVDREWISGVDTCPDGRKALAYFKGTSDQFGLGF
jgi:hypothetical protein